MDIRWGRSRDGKKALSNDANIREDSAETIIRERMHGTLMDQIVSEHAKHGGFDNLEGKGKPLDLSEEVTENFYLHRVLKNADVLPYWLELQHEIRDSLRRLSEQQDQLSESQLSRKIEEMNERIRKYNRVCPSPLFEKPLVSVSNFAEQRHRWA